MCDRNMVILKRISSLGILGCRREGKVLDERGKRWMVYYTKGALILFLIRAIYT